MLLGSGRGLPRVHVFFGKERFAFNDKEFTIDCVEVREGWGVMYESETELFVKRLALIVEPTIHGARARSGFIGVLTSRV